MITLEKLDKVYQTDEIETVALNNINLSIDRGEFVSIMGPSGCGKSTLLNMIGLLDNPTNGSVSIDNFQIENWPDKKLALFRNKKLGYIFQSFHLINDIPVIDNVELPLLYRKGVTGKERRQKALDALKKVGLSARTKHYPSQLSGGQKQRVAIARAIVGHPNIILADEPTGNLDSKMGGEIMDILQNLNKNENTTIVMVTHDEHLSKQTNRIFHLFDGMQVD
ncbi:ABC transporter ATP-binding protein [candidate division KSB1 bacterium]|nr:ABC transporter ATP-binding protein [candidate division KSB1 bacterium]